MAGISDHDEARRGERNQDATEIEDRISRVLREWRAEVLAAKAARWRSRLKGWWWWWRLS
ncbi:hypothetical protein FFI89_018850 [Bradyrhizobium sp. KBS0727]|uniref:hypothetical protein n=1 Tax=unclassified Bradyrhizobium TaxID=2631580 RepID=UPI00110D93F3|nr:MULTISPECIES: hypothetical protein [unclassified Bradyrhizobium]QDW39025.1 hypothetical protein FFI71_018850 [Bradyrhizobium sp. KBS0725]QDW45628.1 hypothetical protein FFI89_018850 [Bradyrhizobium sp. KBS0727]